MMSNGFIYIRNAEDDAYVNHGNNFKGMEQASSGVVILYFESPISSAGFPAAYDKITLAVTANKEKEAMVDINGALFGGKAGSTTTLADDYGTAYCSDYITSGAGVTTIAKAQSGMVHNTRIITSSGAVTAGESGSTILVNTASADITLPAAVAGMTYKFIFGVDTDASMSFAANAGDCFYGNIKVISTTADNTEVQEVARATALAAPGTYDFLDFDHDVTTLGGFAGDSFTITCDGGACWHVDAVIGVEGNPGTIAVINAG